MKINSKKVLVNILLGAVIPISVSFLLLSPIMVPSGIPFYGDETYYNVTPKSFYFNPFNWFFSWVPAYGPAPSPLTLFSYSIPFISLTYLLGQEYVVKLFILVVAALPAILTFFATKILAEEWPLFKREKEPLIFSSLSALFMLLAFTNGGLIGAGTAPAWSYIILPISFALLVRYLHRGSVKYVILLSLASLFAIANPFWIYLFFIMAFLYVMIEVISTKERSILIKRSLAVALALLAVNAFWLVPTAAAYLSGAGGFFQVYTTEQLISFGGLRFLSHWNLLDVMMVGERSHYFFWLHPQNYTWLNAVIPLLAAASILLFRKNKYVLFIAVVLVVGIFLTKGVWEPGGHAYYLIAKNLPYGAGAILRNPTKFVPLVTFSYAFLIGLFIAAVYGKLSSIKFSKSKLNSKAFKLGIVGSSMLLVLSPITYGTLLDLQGYTWPRYSPTYIPHVYDEINEWLSRQQGDFKVMWIPSSGAYIWKPYIITAFPDLYSSRPSVYFGRVYPQPWKSTDSIGRVLSVLGVKYVIYHGDSIGYNNDEILQDIMGQKDLRTVYSLNYTYIPEDDSGKPLPSEREDVKFSNSPFQLNGTDRLLRGEDTALVLRYKIPQDVVESGYKGKFWAGFGIGLNGFPAGSLDPYRRVFWAGVENQIMISETEGYAVFKVRVPKNYPGTSIDVYANFYDGSFKPLTPSYFVARLPVVPTEVVIPFIVFQNDKYNGATYAGNLALTYGPDLSFDLFNTSIWTPVPIEKISESQDLPNLLDNAGMFIYSNSSLPQWLDERLASSNMRLVYLLPIENLNIMEEKIYTGPFNHAHYVYDEAPLVPISKVTLERSRTVQATFRYYLPGPVIDEGYKGKFWAGFGISLRGYPHNVAPPPDEELKYRVFENFISDFTLENDYSGYVTFNIAVPANFQGSYIDVYANFYDGSFRSISPVYFVGTFPVRGVTLVKPKLSPPLLHIVDDSLPLSIYIPRSGEYILAVRFNGTLSINGTTLKGNGEWMHLGPIRLERGNVTIDLSTAENAYIQSVILFGGDQEVKSVSELFDVKAANIISYKQISPVEWKVVVNTSEPFILTFTEPYDRLWTCYVDGREIKSIPAYGMVNGFQINSPGLLRIRLYYTLQTYFNVGMVISSISFVILAIFAISQRRKNRVFGRRAGR